MTPTPLRYYGIREARQAADALDAHAEAVGLVGFTVVPSGLSDDDLAGFRRRIDAVMERQSVAAGGAEALARIGEAMTARALLVEDPAFLALATHPDVLGVVERLLGEYVILSLQNAIINPANERHHQTAYHRDLPYQHFVSSRPLAINALFCCDPFTPETGATLIVPASHKVEAFPSSAVIDRLEQSVTAPAGSFVIFDSMLYHRSGANRTDRPRRAVNHLYTLPFIKQQIVLPAALEGRFADDPKLARLLGYDSDPASSVDAWRARRRPVGGA